ncbi:CdaR family transcriptional regulator [Bacillus sp. EB600]|uniref:PucR family transcriptional regulator n=1 Tax=Bacillus sp. EB600 TaxID=2806345 RepID=UPI00210EF12F|nr:helix-turn-helix domain-containing protein [Bacillus sp. EB600]MCQ6278552.1 helix-turn-helix domain-containing protein [Bacillus sp. EB600]
MNKQLAIPNFVQELLTESSKGVDQIVRKLSAFLSCPVLVTDPFYQPISCSMVHTDMAEIVVIPSRDEESHSLFACQISTLDSLKNGLASSIDLNHKQMGFLIVVSDRDLLGASVYEQILQFSASLCALQIQKKVEIKQEKGKFKDAFLFDLLYGNIKKKDDIIDYGLIWGWDFTVPYMIMVFSFIEYDHFFTDQNPVNILLQLVEKELIHHQLNPITMAKQAQIITLIPQHTADVGQFKLQLESFANYILSQAKKIELKPDIACGMGKIYSNPAELFRSYQEAKVAFELGILLKMPTPFFTDLGLERILYKHDLQDLREYFDHTLGALIDYDADHEGNLLETLDALNANQFDMGKTANALFLHRNTLRYRVKRMEEILNVKFDDINERLNITAAFKIKLLRKL